MRIPDANLFHWRSFSFWAPVLIATIGGIAIGCPFYVVALVLDFNISTSLVLFLTGTVLILLPGWLVGTVLMVIRNKLIKPNSLTAGTTQGGILL